MGVKDIHQRLLGVLGCLTFLYLLYHVKSGETDNQDLGKICKSESKEDSMIENPKPKAEMPNEATQRREVEKDDKLRVVEDVMAVLRVGEAAQVTALINLKVEGLTPEAAMDRFYREVSTPLQGVCHSLKRIGGLWIADQQAADCDKFVCFDAFTSRDCLIYSFGIRDAWQFEDLMDKLNCSVHAYDPSVSYPPTRGRHTSFQQLGVAAARDDQANMQTLSNLMAANGHTDSRVFYLKVDIEGMELAALPEWVESGALAGVEQLAMELHLPTVHDQHRFPWLLKLLQQLYKLGFRVISHEVNMTVKSTSSGYHSHLEVVLMRDTAWSYLDSRPGLANQAGPA